MSKEHGAHPAGQITDKSKMEISKQQQQFAALQKQIQSIALQVHRYDSISRINILKRVKDLGSMSGYTTPADYVTRSEIYRVASSYLTMNMDMNLFVYVTPEKRKLLKTKIETLREKKREVQKLHLEDNILTVQHSKVMNAWHKAIEELEQSQSSIYSFASMRRIHMRGANTLPIDLVNLLDHEVIFKYNNERNRIQRVESGFEEQKEKIEELKSQFKLWTTNLHLLFIIMKYTFGISKETNVKKCIQGQGLGKGDNKAEFRKRAAAFVMNTSDKDLENLIEQDDKMGLSWVAVPGVHSNNTRVFDEKEKFKLQRVLETTLKQVGTETHAREDAINLSKHAWKDCGIRIVYPDTRITVDEVTFKPNINQDMAIYKLAMRDEMTSTEQTKDFIMYCRALNPSFPDYYADKPRSLRA